MTFASAGKAAGVLCQLVAPQFQADQTLAQGGVFGIHQALLNRLQEARNGGFSFLMGVPQLGEPLAVLVFAVRSGAHVSLQHFAEAIGLQDPLRYLPNHDLVQTSS